MTIIIPAQAGNLRRYTDYKIPAFAGTTDIGI